MTDSENPFFQSWSEVPFAAPPFAKIREEHFRPAFQRALEEGRREIAAIAAQAAAPDFDNTIVALEKAGEALSRVAGVFDALTGAAATPELDEIDEETAPLRSAYGTELFQNLDLFRRVAAVRESTDLSPAARRLTDKFYLDFKNAGAHLDAEAKAEIQKIEERLSVLGSRFRQNVSADAKAFVLPLPTAADRAGLSAAYLESASRAAEARGLTGPAATLGISSTYAFLAESTRRDLREIVYKAQKARGQNDNANNNVALAEESAALKRRKAEILGYPTYAAFKLADKMAGTPEAVEAMHQAVWRAARKALLRDEALFAERARADGIEKLEPWDWWYYAEQIRQRDYAFDENEVKPYLTLDNAIQAAFFVAEKLFGLHFAERKDIPVYHPDVRTFEATDAAGRHVAVFYGDYFARLGKRDGAWENDLRGQNGLTGETPLVYNVCNFGEPPVGKPACLSLDDYRTLFHEFGHALHVMLSEAPYPSLAGTNVLLDFVEFPSQLYELFALDDAILNRFALQAETGQPMPLALRDKIRAAETFNQGFQTAEILASAELDMMWHTATEAPKLEAVEKATAEKLEMPAFVQPRHLSAHFSHIFENDYDAGYYSYMWADILVADAFEAFKQAGDLFEPNLAARLRRIYSAGDSQAPGDLFRAFRGRDPDSAALLRHRGLAD